MRAVSETHWLRGRYPGGVLLAEVRDFAHLLCEAVWPSPCARKPHCSTRCTASRSQSRHLRLPANHSIHQACTCVYCAYPNYTGTEQRRPALPQRIGPSRLDLGQTTPSTEYLLEISQFDIVPICTLFRCIASPMRRQLVGAVCFPRFRGRSVNFPTQA